MRRAIPGTTLDPVFVMRQKDRERRRKERERKKSRERYDMSITS